MRVCINDLPQMQGGEKDKNETSVFALCMSPLQWPCLLLVPPLLQLSADCPYAFVYYVSLQRGPCPLLSCCCCSSAPTGPMPASTMSLNNTGFALRLSCCCCCCSSLLTGPMPASTTFPTSKTPEMPPQLGCTCCWWALRWQRRPGGCWRSGLASCR